ncbi:hypothetical protein BP5796_09306 [Coleophoma crateriformis]|uniref:Uncharacterized protein n=1 Tax=Coleophoma crateriformis TaxID=565419 RepID=A0A3D8R3R4_9HELO|nr:hypothetical protein BP5796_09306 [Coleophoma crateriformis]
MQSVITSDKWRPINPFRTRFSPVPSSEDDSVDELEERLSRPTQSVFSGLGQKITCFSAILSPILLLLLILNQHGTLHADNDHSAHAIFGDIPWIPRPFRADDRFINEDPYAGKAWSLYQGKSFAFERESTVWDDIYPGDFIAIENPERFGYDGGVDLSAIAENPTEFAAGTQGFGLAFLHQIHCVVRKELP